LPYALGAQGLCDGTPGAEALFLDFGSGPNFGPELPPGTTTYGYTTNPMGGTYLVTNTADLNGGAWHTAEDHTPNDSDGYMLLFDATDEPGEFFNRTLDGLCPGTRYEFKLWVTNVVVPAACDFSSIEPDIRLEIIDPVTGNVLGSTETGPLPTTENLIWVPAGLTFTLPDGVGSVQLLLINNAPGGCGNDLAIDDISLRICNPTREDFFSICAGDSVLVNGQWYSESGVYTDTLPGAPACNDSILITRVQVVEPAFRSIDTTLCEGEVFRFGGEAYRQGGLYRDTVRTPSGCDSLIVEIDLSFASFFASLYIASDTIEMGEATQFAATASGAGNIRWTWTPSDGLSCTDCPAPTVQPVRTTTYMLEVEDELTGCFATFATRVTVLPCERFYLPNAFSPNDDGRNDVFQVFPGGCVQSVQRLEIYDRWGGQLYAGSDEDTFWNGNCRAKPCPQGLYVYRVHLLLIDGSVVERVGEVQLVR
jgi:gliding motility-associated-like protein